MAFSNTPAAVKGALINAIALAAPAASFTSGVEIGMKKPSKLMVTPNTTMMSSDNAWVDSYKVAIEAEGLQNDFGTLSAVHTYSETYVQAYLNNAGGGYLALTGQTSDDETLCGLEYEWVFKANEDSIKYKIMTELSKATLDSAYSEATTDVWTAGVDATKRKRPGVKSVTFGGAHLGALRSCEGSVKSKSVYVQLGRPLSTGCEVKGSIVMAQTDNTDIEAALAATIGSDTIIINFWNGQILKLTNLLGGKAMTLEQGADNTIKIDFGGYFPKGTDRVKINTVAGTAEFVFLDNTAEA